MAASRLGAVPLGPDRCEFIVWAPLRDRVQLHLVSPRDRLVPMERSERGYHRAIVEGVAPGARYLYRLGESLERPDPASRSQPEGVHGPSEVMDTAGFTWSDTSWFGVPLEKLIFYELHVGAFTPAGTFQAIIPRLAELKNLGVTAIEIMPVAQFPGTRNWGYDGVYPFAVQDSYGGLLGLQQLVNACHEAGLALALDVVYNHLGPDGNYLGDYGPYFTDQYTTPWGRAVNLDGPGSDDVRRYFIENALYWFEACHVDVLRLDAIHAMMDRSAHPFLEELQLATADRATSLNRRLYLVAESDLNDARVILPRALGGYGLDAQWSDDLHHAIHALLTGERDRYYQDFGTLGHVAAAWRDGFAYSGQYSPFRQRRHGNSPRLNEARQFVVATQTHDQVGNRARGERLAELVSFEALKLAAGTVLLSPFLPLLFMGEEYAETAPFQYFTSHLDPGLAEAVRRGRREEFAYAGSDRDVPDPQDEATFLRSKLNWEIRHQGRHRVLLEFYRELIRMRSALPALAHLSKEHTEVATHENALALVALRWFERDCVLVALCFNDCDAEVMLRLHGGLWHKHLDSADAMWLGPGGTAPDAVDTEGDVRLTLRARSVVVYRYQPRKE